MEIGKHDNLGAETEVLGAGADDGKRRIPARSGISNDRTSPFAPEWSSLLTRVLEFVDADGTEDIALKRFLVNAGSLISASGASLYLYNEKLELAHEASYGLSNGLTSQIEEMARTDMWGRLVGAQNSLAIIEDIRTPLGDEQGVIPLLEMLAAEGVTTLSSFPLTARDNSLGFLTFYHNTQYAYAQEEIEGLSLIADVLALAIYNNRLAETRKVEDTGRDHFISALSHELRTPLTSIIGFTQIIRRKLASAPVGDARMAEHMEVIWAQAQRLNRLIDTFVDIANIEQGDFTVKFTRVEIISTLKSAIEQAVAQVNPTCKVEIETPDSPLWVRGNGQRLEQVFNNIVSNALRYSPTECPVVITCVERMPDGKVEISVRDKGPGISRNLRDAIFKRFYQAEALKSGGLGVGLYLSKTIVEAHGGEIVVESEMGEGTTMSIILPAY